MTEEQCQLMQSVLLYRRGLYRSTDASTCEGIMGEGIEAMKEKLLSALNSFKCNICLSVLHNPYSKKL